MSNLRICKAMSLHPSANIAGHHSEFIPHPSSSSRICLMGCKATPSELRRFPVHDINRCNYWLRHFGLSDQFVQELGGLKKLRICFRHFTQRKAMAKTRIKTTPLRQSKHNTTITTAALATTTTATLKPMADSTTIELVDSSSGDASPKTMRAHIKQEKSVTTITPVPVPVPVSVPVSVPVPVPQRSHSICSSSSVSSDVQSISSDYEASMPLSALVAAQGQNGVAKTTNGLAKKRKLYLITEKSDEKNGNSAASGQKRKMFVVVEQEKDTQCPTKKLMIVTDKSKANLTQHLEKFLPEILSCIQDKEQAQSKAIKQAIKQEQQLLPTPAPVPTPAPIKLAHKPHITLPPKKNPTNFVKLENSAGISLPASVSILPVVPVKEQPPLPLELETELEKEREREREAETETETNINLSPDFRFLMKILPKLEQLPEPHKQHVKRSIQIFVEESYSHYGKKD